MHLLKSPMRLLGPVLAVVLCAELKYAYAATAAEPERCKPPERGLVVFEQPRYQGPCSALPQGASRAYDKAGSLRLASFARGTVCWRMPWGVSCHSLFSDDPDLGGSTRTGPFYLALTDRDGRDSRCEPQPDGVAAQGDKSGLGPCLQWRSRSLPDPVALGLIDNRQSRLGAAAASAPKVSPRAFLRADDRLFLRVGAQAQAQVCREDGLAGNCEELSANQAAWVSGLRSVSVTPECRPGEEQLAIYARAGWRGLCRVLGIAVHELPALSLDDRPFASMRLGTGVRVQRCEGAAASGRCFAVERDERDTPAGTLSMQALQARPEPPAVAASTPP